MVPIYLDDCMVAHRLVRQLREAGHLIYVPAEQSMSGQSDPVHLHTATSLGAVLVTQNDKHFAPLHRHWQFGDRPHAGIILVPGQTPMARKFACLDRAGRLLTSEAARNQLMYLSLFETEARAAGYVRSLTPLLP